MPLLRDPGRGVLRERGHREDERGGGAPREKREGGDPGPG